MKKQVLILTLAAVTLLSYQSHSEDKHDEKGKDQHTEASTEKKHDDHKHQEDESDDHEKEAGHTDEYEHDHEENDQVGPGKGIVSADEALGFKISPEAEKNFEIKKMLVPKETTFEIAKSAIVTAAMEINVYRVRDGFYKRIDFIFVNKKETTSLIKSSDLKQGDEIVIAGTGLLRIAEIAAFGGAPEGHSH